MWHAIKRLMGVTHHECPNAPHDCEEVARREHDEALKRDVRERIQRMKDELAVINHERNSDSSH